MGGCEGAPVVREVEEGLDDSGPEPLLRELLALHILVLADIRDELYPLDACQILQRVVPVSEKVVDLLVSLTQHLVVPQLGLRSDDINLPVLIHSEKEINDRGVLHLLLSPSPSQTLQTPHIPALQQLLDHQFLVPGDHLLGGLTDQPQDLDVLDEDLDLHGLLLELMDDVLHHLLVHHVLYCVLVVLHYLLQGLDVAGLAGFGIERF